LAFCPSFRKMITLFLTKFFDLKSISLNKGVLKQNLCWLESQGFQFFKTFIYNVWYFFSCIGFQCAVVIDISVNQKTGTTRYSMKISNTASISCVFQDNKGSLRINFKQFSDVCFVKSLLFQPHIHLCNCSLVFGFKC
jgi:hypothetical protein